MHITADLTKMTFIRSQCSSNRLLQVALQANQILNTVHKTNNAILYVDDEEMSLKYFRKSFENKYPIFIATNGSEAFDILNKNHKKIALIVSDQRMPDTDGITLLKQAKKAFPLIPRILVTAYSDYDVLVEAINKCVISHFIEKPWEVEKLTGLINYHIDLYKKCKSVHILEAISNHNSIPDKIMDLPYTVARRKYLDIFEKQYVENLLVRHENNISAVARSNMISRKTIQRVQNNRTKR